MAILGGGWVILVVLVVVAASFVVAYAQQVTLVPVVNATSNIVLNGGASNQWALTYAGYEAFFVDLWDVGSSSGTTTLMYNAATGTFSFIQNYSLIKPPYSVTLGYPDIFYSVGYVFCYCFIGFGC